MYEKIKKDIQQDYYVKNFPNEGQRFVAWYLRNIHNLDPIETKSCITDGAGDKQIDAVYINNQECVIYIIQGKFYSGEKIDAQPLREVLSSWIMINNLEKLQESANDRLASKINEIRMAIDEDDYDICFELITTSSLTNAAQKDLEIFQGQLLENEQINASISLVDNDMLKAKYNNSTNSTKPFINFDFTIETDKIIKLTLGSTNVVLAAIPLKECLKIPGIKDGSLFRKNVRQSLGTKNAVNKGIAKTLKTDADNFFFYHNGITAICTKLDICDNKLSVKDLNVVNGCQSLSTIYNCSEAVRKSQNGYIMFRFYEISDPARAENITKSTNSQSAVKARDLRSNDKAVLMMKKSFEQTYTDGYFITKRGEYVDTVKYNTSHIVNLTDLGKFLIAWHSQRPTISYSETKIFDKYFNQLFKKDYDPEDMLALTNMFKEIDNLWKDDTNPLNLEEMLLAMKAYAPYHLLYTISVIVCELNKMPDNVPSPHKVYFKLSSNNILDNIIKVAATCLNTAFKNANSQANDNSKIFSPQNWIKAKGCLNDIKSSVRSYLSLVQTQLIDQYDNYKKVCKLDTTDFEPRWTAE